MKGDSASILPDLAAIRAAHARIAPHVHRTPVLTCTAIDAEVGAHLFFKCENFQKVGAFKARGATNAVQLLDAQGAGAGSLRTRPATTVRRSRLPLRGVAFRRGS